MKTKIDGFYLSFIILGFIAIIFILLPPLKTIFYTPVSTLRETVLDAEVYNSISLTIIAALLATASGLLLGVPLAYLLARRQFWGKRLLEAVIDIPIVIPHSIAAMGILISLIIFIVFRMIISRNKQDELLISISVVHTVKMRFVGNC